MTERELAENYVYEAWNQTDHADTLVRFAKGAIASGDFEQTLEDLRMAQTAADKAVSRIRWAIEKVEKARDAKERP